MDDNGYPIIYGVSHLDGITPIRVAFNPSNRGIKTDAVTSITFNPAIVPNQNTLRNFPFAKGTSTADDTTVLPWVVNASTGAVLISP